MMNISNIILGLLFALFIPGFLLSIILLKKLNFVERICLSFVLSVVIVVFISFFLSMLSYFFDIKAINAVSVWLSLLFFSIAFSIIGILIYKDHAKKENRSGLY